MAIIYKFVEKDICIQPSGEPRKHILREVRTKKVRATQYFIEDNMTGRVNILWRMFQKIPKKLKMKVIYSKHVQKLCFFRSYDFNLNFLNNECLNTLPVILSFRNFFVVPTSIISILFDSSGFFMFMFHNPNYLEIKKKIIP